MYTTLKFCGAWFLWVSFVFQRSAKIQPISALKENEPSKTLYYLRSHLSFKKVLLSKCRCSLRQKTRSSLRAQPSIVFWICIFVPLPQCRSCTQKRLLGTSQEILQMGYRFRPGLWPDPRRICGVKNWHPILLLPCLVIFPVVDKMYMFS